MSKSLNALLISSNPVVNEEYYGALTGCSLEVFLAQSLRAATRTLLAEPIDVVVCDDHALYISFTAIVEATRCFRGNIPIIIWSSGLDAANSMALESWREGEFLSSTAMTGDRDLEAGINPIVPWEKVC
ncbi:MAG TPA: hypothetical protein VL128_17000 [Candidatus Eisenbacteria bacterium]|nr:hypothetical protein [Candidatus Eisenbacteria bacterium]